MIDQARLYDAAYRQHIIDSLWDEHGEEIRQYCNTRLGSGLAEEFTQEVFIAAWQGLPKYRADQSLRACAWLYSIADNMCRQSYRNRARRAAIAQTCLEEIRRLSHAEAPRLLEQQAEAAGQLQQLLDSMAKLSHDERILINLRYWQGLPMQEIASLMNKSSPTIRKRLERAQRRLKEYMEEAEYETHKRSEPIRHLPDRDEALQVTRRSQSDPELLQGLSEEELQALAQSTLTTSDQDRMEDLLARNADSQLSEAEQAELDRLVDHVDYLTLLKTRARYTLAHQAGQLQTP